MISYPVSGKRLPVSATKKRNFFVSHNPFVISDANKTSQQAAF